MKNIKDILAHLKYSPKFKKINTQEALNKLTSAMPKNLQNGIKFCYTKQETLYFVLTHPVYKMEFEYNKDLVKRLLKDLRIANINDIKFFVTNVVEKKEIQNVKHETREDSFKERSYGIFENMLEERKLYDKVEQIRNIIKKNS